MGSRIKCIIFTTRDFSQNTTKKTYTQCWNEHAICLLSKFIETTWFWPLQMLLRDTINKDFVLQTTFVQLYFIIPKQWQGYIRVNQNGKSLKQRRYDPVRDQHPPIWQNLWTFVVHARWTATMVTCLCYFDIWHYPWDLRVGFRTNVHNNWLGSWRRMRHVMRDNLVIYRLRKTHHRRMVMSWVAPHRLGYWH